MYGKDLVGAAHIHLEQLWFTYPQLESEATVIQCIIHRAKTTFSKRTVLQYSITVINSSTTLECSYTFMYCKERKLRNKHVHCSNN